MSLQSRSRRRIISTHLLTALAASRRDIGPIHLVKMVQSVKMMSCETYLQPRTLSTPDFHRPNSFARVTGTIKTYGSKKYINATHIRPIRDAHEPFFHMLEVMAVQLIFDRGPVGNFIPASVRGQLMIQLARVSCYRQDARGERKALVICIHRRAGSSIRSPRPIFTSAARSSQHRSIHAESATDPRRRACRCYCKSHRSGRRIY